LPAELRLTSWIYECWTLLSNVPIALFSEVPHLHKSHSVDGRFHCEWAL